MSDCNSSERKIFSQLKVAKIENDRRWEVFHRLQDLEISCQCSAYKPLLVQIDSPQTAVQLWSVVKQVNSSRCELIDWLNRCWQIERIDNER